MKKCVCCCHPFTGSNQAYNTCRYCGHAHSTYPPQQIADPSDHHVAHHKLQWDFSELKYRNFYLPLLHTIGIPPPDGTLLDIGCANGAFAAAARTFGWNRVQGIEPRIKSAAHARQHTDAVFEGPLERFKSSHRFDVITLWQVIEHVWSLDPFMRKLCMFLKPEGKIVVSTPNFLSLGRRLLGDRWPAWTPEVHYHLFTPSSLKKLFDQYHLCSVSTCTQDILPGTLKRILPTGLHYRSSLSPGETGRFIHATSSRNLKVLLFLRGVLNHFLRRTNLGDDIYATFAFSPLTKRKQLF